MPIQLMVWGYAGLLAVMSLVTFVVYGLDKRQAGHGSWRVSERTLHWLSFWGGWPGAFAGQRQFRHKTQKFSFRVVFWLVLVAHFIAFGSLAYLLRMNTSR